MPSFSNLESNVCPPSLLSIQRLQRKNLSYRDDMVRIVRPRRIMKNAETVDSFRERDVAVERSSKSSSSVRWVKYLIKGNSSTSLHAKCSRLEDSM